MSRITARLNANELIAGDIVWAAKDICYYELLPDELSARTEKAKEIAIGKGTPGTILRKGERWSAVRFAMPDGTRTEWHVAHQWLRFDPPHD